MFAKGPMPGATPKNDFLKAWPGATCKRQHYENGMSAYVVELENGTFVAARGSPSQAWSEAYSVMLRREERTKETASKKSAPPK